MQPTSPKSLSDALRACDLILQHTAGRTLDDYERDPFFRAAVERWFEIIGEALRRLERKDPAIAASLPDLRDIIDFRNVLAHGYDDVENDSVWSFVQNELPLLREQVVDLLRAPDPSDETASAPDGSPPS